MQQSSFYNSQVGSHSVHLHPLIHCLPYQVLDDMSTVLLNETAQGKFFSMLRDVSVITLSIFEIEHDCTILFNSMEGGTIELQKYFQNCCICTIDVNTVSETYKR